MSQLDVHELWSGYDGPPVLQGVDLSVPTGSIAAVLGPSGCGKTTLLRVIAGFERPDAGSVVLGGRAVAGPDAFVPPERRRIGVVPQEGALFPHLSVAGNVAFGLARTWARAGRDARVRELLDLVGLADLGGRMPAQLSGGQQQRIAVARALAAEPELVLLDEPFNALDAGLRASVRADVRSALYAAGATAILVTHDQEEALSCADLVAVMASGRIAQMGSPLQVYQQPHDLTVATFVGEATVLPAVAREGWAQTSLGQLCTHGETAGPGYVVIRPEQIRFATTGTQARVVETEFYGHDAKITLEVKGEDGDICTLTARTLDAEQVQASGSDVAIHVAGPVTFFATPPRDHVLGHED